MVHARVCMCVCVTISAQGAGTLIFGVGLSLTGQVQKNVGNKGNGKKDTVKMKTVTRETVKQETGKLGNGNKGKVIISEMKKGKRVDIEHIDQYFLQMERT